MQKSSKLSMSFMAELIREYHPNYYVGCGKKYTKRYNEIRDDLYMILNETNYKGMRTCKESIEQHFDDILPDRVKEQDYIRQLRPSIINLCDREIKNIQKDTSLTKKQREHQIAQARTKMILDLTRLKFPDI